MVRKRYSLDDSVLHLKSQHSFHKSSDEPSPLSPADSAGSVFVSSESENGTDEKKKTGKSPTGVSPTSPNDAEWFDDPKKVAPPRSKTIVDNTLLTTDGKDNSKPVRKKHTSHQFKANAHFHKLFLDVPIDEPLRQNFTCALQKEIVYQGKLFISQNWICFHSKVFGKDTKITIPVPSVTLLKKTKTALLVPNALVISTISERYMFVSFLSRDQAYKLLKSVCRHLEGVSDGNSPSPSPSSLENSFRADRPTTLPLDFSEDFSELDGIIHQHRQELEESSSTGSQTPELERFQGYHIVETHLKASKAEGKPAIEDVEPQCSCDDDIRNASRNASPRVLQFFHRLNSKRLITVNHILVLYAILVCLLIFSTFYMKYKIHILEEQLGSIVSYVDSHHNEHPLQEGLDSHLHLNVDGLCKELTANLIKLEKIQNNLQRLLEDSK